MSLDPYKPNANIVLHSEAPNGEQLITMEVNLHRFILPENNTHRSLSRNYQSSRACPVSKQLEQVATNPAMPVFYGKNKKGMQANEELTGTDRKLAEMIILGMRDACLNGVKQLAELGLHKQSANRYIEPWLWTKGIITATLEDLEAFFFLRCHEDAQPEIRELAEHMKAKVRESIPVKLEYGEYHLPYVERKGSLSLKNAVKVSVSCNAQVSYRVLDDSLEKALSIYDMLHLPVEGMYPDDPCHYSPTEHVAKVVEKHEHTGSMGGNFHGETFWQFRKALEAGQEGIFLNE